MDDQVGIKIKVHKVYEDTVHMNELGNIQVKENDKRHERSKSYHVHREQSY